MEVIAVFENMKDFFLFCYEAAARMEEKSAYFAEERAKRMEQFRQERREAAERVKERIGQVKAEKTEKVREMIKESGLATKSELDEVKKMLADLSAKFDKLSEK
jgi:chromosome condensin MukBEF ATPase and DNA-binding subunit MukB